MHEPQIYESTGLAFWDDPHISKAMLENHLNPDSAGATRKHDIVHKSVNWLTSLQHPEGSLLDLGCGPGLYAELLAQKGYRVTGVDLSKRSIDYAQQSAVNRDLSITYIQGNYLDLPLPEDEFDMVILIYCDFGVLSSQDRSHLLKKVLEALKPGGLFVVDVFSEDAYRNFSDSSEVSYEQGGFWSNMPHVLITRNKEYPGRHYLECYVVVTKDDCRAYNIWNHSFLASELRGELEEAGFKDVMLYADTLGRDLSEGSETLCAVARKE